MDTQNSSTLTVEYVPVTSLKAADYNPKKWPRSQLDGIRESVSRFGFVDPLVVNGSPKRKNIVIGGHA